MNDPDFQSTRRIPFEEVSINLCGPGELPFDAGCFSGVFEVEEGVIESITLTPTAFGQAEKTIYAGHWLYEPLAKALLYAFIEDVSSTVQDERSDRAEHGTYWGRP